MLKQDILSLPLSPTFNFANPLPTGPSYLMPPTSDSWHVSEQEMKVHQLSQLQHLQYGSRSSLAPVDTTSPRKSASNPILLDRNSVALQAQPVVGPHVIAKNTPNG